MGSWTAGCELQLNDYYGIWGYWAKTIPSEGSARAWNPVAAGLGSDVVLKLLWVVKG